MRELEAALRVTRGRLDSVLTALDEYLYAWRYSADGSAVIDYESIPQATFLAPAARRRSRPRTSG